MATFALEVALGAFQGCIQGSGLEMVVLALLLYRAFAALSLLP